MTATAPVVATPIRALGAGRLEGKLSISSVQRMLVIDEIGYRPIDRVIGTAILGRVLQRAIALNIRGKSYRLKEKRKVGLIRAEEPAPIN